MSFLFILFLQICVGGKDISAYGKYLRSQIGLVGQEPVLFDTTVAENISLGKPEATKEEIEKATKDANAHDFVSSMPEGYNTNVGKYRKCSYSIIPKQHKFKMIHSKIFIVSHSC